MLHDFEIDDVECGTVLRAYGLSNSNDAEGSRRTRTFKCVDRTLRRVAPGFVIFPSGGDGRRHFLQ